MGLAIGVGELADLNENDAEGAVWLRKALKRVNAVLRENDLPAHSEPEKLPPLPNRAALQGYPYSFLHHLRRFAAHAKAEPKWKPKPFPESENPADDPVIADEQAMLDSHLLCHSDCEGFYVPIDFDDPLFADEKQIPGGMLGSSQGLMRELVAVAPFWASPCPASACRTGRRGGSTGWSSRRGRSGSSWPCGCRCSRRPG